MNNPNCTLNIEDVIKFLTQEREVYHKDSLSYWCYSVAIKKLSQEITCIKKSINMYTKTKIVGELNLFDETNEFICSCGINGKIELSKAHAKRLSLCWNSHDKLIKALKEIKKNLATYKIEGHSAREMYCIKVVEQALKESEK